MAVVPGPFHREVIGWSIKPRMTADIVTNCGMTASMSRKGNHRDNAPTESFCNCVKNERMDGARFETRAEAKADVFENIAIRCNWKRRHASMDYCSPTQFLQDLFGKHDDQLTKET